MSTRNLEKIFEPKSIAIIGASDRKGSVGYIIFNNLIGSGYEGVVFPVNSKRNSVQGVKAFPSVSSLPEKPDLAVISTPASTVPLLLEECGKTGIKGIIIISAGFAEMGNEGKELMDKIEEIRIKYDQRIIGPNCLGVIHPKLKMNSSFAKNGINSGKIAFISQSGALGTAVLDWAMSNNIGFSYFVSLGSMLDINFGDMIDYFGADNETESIILYIESIKEAQRFMSASRGFAMNKPIIVVKSGRVAEGAKAAASHTGAMAGEDDIYDAAFKRVGMVRVDEIGDLFNCAETLAKQPRPNGNRLAIITNAGGPGVMATDSLIKNKGKLAEFSEETISKLNEVLPPFWSKSNPVDLLGDAGADRYAQALDICLKDPHIDGALVILTPQAMTESTETAIQLVEKAKGHNKPILASWMGASLVEEGRQILRKGNIPEYETPEQAVKTFMYMYQYIRNIELLYETPEELINDSEPVADKIKLLLREINNSGRQILSESESKEILESYGIKTTSSKLVKNADEAASISKETGFPIVMKIQSEDISHKSDANCVILDIQNEDESKQKFNEIMDNARNYKNDARLDGVTIQRMISSKGYELIIGAKKDFLFGTIILFGMGGIAVEAIKDRNIGIPPLNRTLAKRLIEGTKIYKILKDGLRNIPPANMDILENTLVKFSRLLVELPEIKEIDINPFRIGENEGIALDARMIIDKEFLEKDTHKQHDHLVIMPYPKEYIKKIDIEGKEITLRPIRPEDEPMWIDMFNSFSEETMRFRFFHIIKDMPHNKRVRYTFNDYSREIAIVPVIEENGEKKILGVVRMTGDANHEIAEFAIVLIDGWQGKGLGEHLFDHIMDIARKKGWKKMIAATMPGNIKMINLFKKKGCIVKYDPIEKLYDISYDL